MRASQYRQPLSRWAKAAMGLTLFQGVGAVAGGIALMLGPRGEIIPLKVASLAGSPFETFFVPGLILFTVLGLGPLGVAALIWLRHPLAPIAVAAVGFALLIWLAVEIAIIGFTNDPPIQLAYLVLGVAIALAGLAWADREPRALQHRGMNFR